jgi:thiol-disulfide isomerase/thioredoxin
VGRPTGDRATFVQFSSPICAPCRGTRRVLGAIADETTGVAHLDVDVSERLDLADRFSIQRTPTVLVLDAAGIVRQRLVGPPTRAQALTALATLG